MESWYNFGTNWEQRDLEWDSQNKKVCLKPTMTIRGKAKRNNILRVMKIWSFRVRDHSLCMIPREKKRTMNTRPCILAGLVKGWKMDNCTIKFWHNKNLGKHRWFPNFGNDEGILLRSCFFLLDWIMVCTHSDMSSKFWGLISYWSTLT
jgi:hypothetical protein